MFEEVFKLSKVHLLVVIRVRSHKVSSSSSGDLMNRWRLFTVEDHQSAECVGHHDLQFIH
jgi:hypothetical protein